MSNIAAAKRPRKQTPRYAMSTAPDNTNEALFMNEIVQLVECPRKHHICEEYVKRFDMSVERRVFFSIVEQISGRIYDL